MAQPMEPAELQRPDVLRAQARAWRIERVAWLLMALVIAAGMLGLLGQGVLAHHTARNGPLSLRYDRFVRARSPARLVLEVLHADAARPVRVWLAQDYLDAVKLQGLVPQPERWSSDSGRVVLEFPPAHSGTVRILIDLEPETIGMHQGRIGTGETALRFQQVVFP